MVKYVKLRSWHIPSGIVSRAGLIRTLCGRWVAAGAPEADDFGGERTCETCFRLHEAGEP